MRLSLTMTAPTARRGQVDRVATSCAMRMKYSSHEGRARFSSACRRVVSTDGSLKGSIEAVPRVAEAGYYERVVVEFGGPCRGVEVDVRVLGGDALDGGDGVEAGDPMRPLLLQLAYGCREAAARREHRIQDEHQVLREVPGQVHVVLDRLSGLLVPEEA